MAYYCQNEDYDGDDEDDENEQVVDNQQEVDDQATPSSLEKPDDPGRSSTYPIGSQPEPDRNRNRCKEEPDCNQN